jgi:NADH:ubiquinone oxidoreductase subunit 4 (subunit M)
MSWACRIPVLLLLVTLLLVGFVPEILNQFIRPAVEGIFLTTHG